MLKERITGAIREIIDGGCGFDVFVMMKDGEQIKKLCLYEGDPESGTDSFKTEIFMNIKQMIQTKYLAEDAEYCLAEQLADNQKKFYVIRQDEDYHPFQAISIPEDQIQSFSVEDKDIAQGFLFRFSLEGNKALWAYQHIWPAAIPNKKKKGFFIKILSPDQDDVFVKFSDTLFTITHKVDLLVITSELKENEVAERRTVTEIITANTSLMERTFGFVTFIRASADHVVKSINGVGLVANIEKLGEYLNRGNSNKKYARKMMRVKNSKVFELPQSVLKEKLNTVERRRGKFQFDDEGKIVLNSYRNVEELIDLFDERYTRSDITGQEYDTAVKSVAEGVVKA